eukprot:359823-Chlamydomonas_euryale.AAC.2
MSGQAVVSRPWWAGNTGLSHVCTRVCPWARLLVCAHVPVCGGGCGGGLTIARYCIRNSQGRNNSNSKSDSAHMRAARWRVGLAAHVHCHCLGAWGAHLHMRIRRMPAWAHACMGALGAWGARLHMHMRCMPAWAHWAHGHTPAWAHGAHACICTCGACLHGRIGRMGTRLHGRMGRTPAYAHAVHACMGALGTWAHACTGAWGARLHTRMPRMDTKLHGCRLPGTTASTLQTGRQHHSTCVVASDPHTRRRQQAAPRGLRAPPPSVRPLCPLCPYSSTPHTCVALSSSSSVPVASAAPITAAATAMPTAVRVAPGFATNSQRADSATAARRSDASAPPPPAAVGSDESAGRQIHTDSASAPASRVTCDGVGQGGMRWDEAGREGRLE